MPEPLHKPRCTQLQLAVCLDITWAIQVELCSGVPKFVPGLHVIRRPTILLTSFTWVFQSETPLGIQEAHFPRDENKDKNESKGLGRGS